MTKRRAGKIILLVAGLVILTGLLLPQRTVIPVSGATSRDWNAKTFWFEPWGRSGVHKGIDIFARKGTPVIAATNGLVVFRGEIPMGGKVVAVLGPKWRLHYYAHLDSFDGTAGVLVAKGEVVGVVGDTGNAAGTPPHLHYSVFTILPYPWRWDGATQGWKKMFILDPGRVLGASRGSGA
jgi:murein DD-endopeptidase MepM/ murein hydrolase activator NlpD